MRDDCAFCTIVHNWPGQLGSGASMPARMERIWVDALAFEPLNPVTPGHVLVIPRVHVPDVRFDPIVSGLVMARAAELAAQWPACNIITSAGEAATQTIRHLHLHVVPRHEGDGLALPWTKP